MKAFVYRIDRHGADTLGTGRVSPHYVNFGNFMRYWARKLPAGTYRAYFYHNWHRCYGKPDSVKEFTIKEQP